MGHLQSVRRNPTQTLGCNWRTVVLCSAVLQLQKHPVFYSLGVLIFFVLSCSRYQKSFWFSIKLIKTSSVISAYYFKFLFCFALDTVLTLLYIKIRTMPLEITRMGQICNKPIGKQLCCGLCILKQDKMCAPSGEVAC